MKLDALFFKQNTVKVAKELLGKYVVRKIGRQKISGKIVETEAYCGTEDQACHASKGLTPRTEVMFGPPGVVYVYLIYGIYNCLNFVTEYEGYPAAVLIRGVDLPKCDGPGKLCRELDITREHNGLNLSNNSELWVEDKGALISPKDMKVSKRIGVDYAGEWKNKLWRFYL